MRIEDKPGTNYLISRWFGDDELSIRRSLVLVLIRVQPVIDTETILWFNFGRRGLCFRQDVFCDMLI
jgi:hypothetical protein